MAAPCDRCTRILASAGRLRWKRLGQWERRLLVLAVDDAGSDRDALQPVPIPPRRTNKAQTAQRRAVRSLQDAGLILVLPHEEQRLYDDRGHLEQRVRFMVPSHLGRYVVEACRRELTSKPPKVLPVRWSSRVSRVKRAALDDCGCLAPTDRDRFS